MDSAPDKAQTDHAAQARDKAEQAASKASQLCAASREQYEQLRARLSEAVGGKEPTDELEAQCRQKADQFQHTIAQLRAQMESAQKAMQQAESACHAADALLVQSREALQKQQLLSAISVHQLLHPAKDHAFWQSFFHDIRVLSAANAIQRTIQVQEYVRLC